MRCLLSGNDFCEGPEAKRCHAHPMLRGGGFPRYAFHIILLLLSQSNRFMNLAVCLFVHLALGGALIILFSHTVP